MATAVENGSSAIVTVGKRIVRKHHFLVRVSHWLNIPILLGLGLSGLSVYWAAPIFQHPPDASGNTDCLVDLGRWLSSHVPFMHSRVAAFNDNWFYNHFSLGTGLLATALRLHWLFAYLFMLNGIVYAIGLLVGGGYKALLPKRTDLREALAMIAYYLSLAPAKLLRRPIHHPVILSKYNALQRSAYLSMPLIGLLAIGSGWAIHKPAQFGWLQALFGGYDWARVWHFWIMWIFAAFVIPHVVLVAADGWDTFRSMVVGWSDRIGGAHE